MRNFYSEYIENEERLGCLPNGLIITGLIATVFCGHFWQNLLIGTLVFFLYILTSYVENKISPLEVRIKVSILFLTLFLFLGNIYIVAGERIVDGFTDPYSLAEKIRARDVYKFDGSICRDGTVSDSQGQGTCSWHKGVRRKFYEGESIFSKKESLEMAHKLSWIDY